MKKLILLLTTLIYAGFLFAYDNDFGADNNFYIGKSVGVHIPTLATLPDQVGFFLGPKRILGFEKGELELDSIDDGNFELKSAKYSNNGLFYREYITTWNLNLLATLNEYKLFLTADARVDDDHNSGLVYGSTVEGELEAKALVGCYGIGWAYGYGRLFLGFDVASVCYTFSESVDAEGGNNSQDDDLKDVGEFINDLSSSNRYAMIYLGFIF